MPASAEAALKGLLKEGATADEVLEKLEESGFKVSPPEGDESYSEEGEPVGEEVSEVDAMPEGMPAEELAAPPEGLVAGPPSPDELRKKAVDEAFAEKGL